MDDSELIALFNRRDENAVAALMDKYGGLCRSLIGNILRDRRDVEECVNNDPGQWYGSVYVIDRPNDTAAINAWFTQHGVVFHAVVSWQFGIETAVSFCNVRKVTI